MIRIILISVAAMGLLAGAASAFDPRGMSLQGTHLDGLRAGIAGDAVGAVVLPSGATIALR
jgi:hypothetical protein